MAEQNDSFSYSTDKHEQTYYDVTFGVVALFSFTIGTPGSLMSMAYFIWRDKDRGISSLQYMIINAVDSLTTLLLLSNGISEFTHGRAVMFGWRPFCVVWGYLWQVSIRLSVFLVAVLSISRTVSLLTPLRRMSRQAVLTPILLYTVMLLVQQLLPILIGKSFWYAQRLNMCTWLLTDIVANTTAPQFKALHFVFVSLEFVVPAVPIISSCVISVWVLKKKSTIRSAAGEGKHQRRVKNAATVTIIYLTLAYIVFNIPLIFFCVFESVTLFSNMRITFRVFGIPDPIVGFLYTLVGVHMVALNSTTNVLIYFSRNTGLRVFWINVFCCRWDAVCHANRTSHAQSVQRARRAENQLQANAKNFLEYGTCPASPRPAARAGYNGACPVEEVRLRDITLRSANFSHAAGQMV